MLEKFFACHPDKTPHYQNKDLLTEGINLNKYIENEKYILQLVGTLLKSGKLYTMIHINIKVRTVIKFLFKKNPTRHFVRGYSFLLL